MAKNKIQEDGIEYDPLAYFMITLMETTNEGQDDAFFHAFVKYIREGNSIKDAIQYAKKEVEDE